MPDRLEIIVSLKDVATRQFSKISSAARRFGASIVDGAKRAGRGLLDLAKNIFFVGNAISMVTNLAGRLFDKFVKGAGDLKKLETRFKHLTGSQEAAAAVMEEVKAVALATGKDIMDVGEAYALIAVNARDANNAFDPAKLTEIADLLQFLSALRPDLPLALIQRGINQLLTSGQATSLEMIMDMPIRGMLEQAGILGAVADDITGLSEEIGGAATFIQTGAAGQAASELKVTAEQVRAAVEAFTGISAAEMIEDIAEKSGMERLAIVADDLVTTFGGPLFEALNQFASTLSDMYEADPEKFRQLAEALGDLAAKGLGGLLDPIIEGLSSGDFIDAVEKVTKFLELLQAGKVDAAFELLGIEDFAANMGDVIEALGTIAETLISIASVLGADKEEPGALAGGAKTLFGGKTGRAEVAEQWYGKAAGAGQAIIQEAISGPAGMENVKRAVAMELADILGINIGQKPQRVEVVVSLDSDLLQAQVTQTSEGIVTDSFNQLGEKVGGHR